MPMVQEGNTSISYSSNSVHMAMGKFNYREHGPAFEVKFWLECQNTAPVTYLHAEDTAQR